MIIPARLYPLDVFPAILGRAHFLLPERVLCLETVHQIVDRLQRLEPMPGQRRHQHDLLSRMHAAMAVNDKRVDDVETRAGVSLDLADLFLCKVRIGLELQRAYLTAHSLSGGGA